MSGYTSYQTDELIGPALDFAVRFADGIRAPVFPSKSASTDWAVGGVIIQRHNIAFTRALDAQNRPYWVASLYRGDDFEMQWRYSASGETHLIAAMRAYVKAYVGASLRIPNIALDPLPPPPPPSPSPPPRTLAAAEAVKRVSARSGGLFHVATEAEAEAVKALILDQFPSCPYGTLVTAGPDRGVWLVQWSVGSGD